MAEHHSSSASTDGVVADFYGYMRSIPRSGDVELDELTLRVTTACANGSSGWEYEGYTGSIRRGLFEKMPPIKGGPGARRLSRDESASGSSPTGSPQHSHQAAIQQTVHG